MTKKLILALFLTQICWAWADNGVSTVKAGYSKTYSESSGWSKSASTNKKDYTSGGYGSYYDHKSTSYEPNYRDITEDLRELYNFLRQIPPS